MQVQLKYNNSTHSISLPPAANLACLQSEIYSLLHVPPTNQKLIYRGRPLTNEEAALSQLSIRDGARLLLLLANNASPTLNNQQGNFNRSTLFPGMFARGPRQITPIGVREDIIANGPPTGAIKGFPNTQTTVLPAEPFIVYDDNGDVTYLSVETDGLFIRNNKEEGERIFLTDITGFGIEQINNTYYHAMALEFSGKKLVLYFIPSQYSTFFVNFIKSSPPIYY